MPELVRMKALRSWHNDQFEGVISFGREFFATEDRARELERSDPKLAERMPALSGQTVEVKADPPKDRSLPLAERPAKNRKPLGQNPLF